MMKLNKEKKEEEEEEDYADDMNDKLIGFE